MKLTKPKRISEATIQAELYMQLKLSGFECCLEYPIKLKDSSMRADVAVFHNGYVLCLIELKSRRIGNTPNKGTRQYKKYLSTGLPFCYCMHLDEIPSVLKWVNLHINILLNIN